MVKKHKGIIITVSLILLFSVGFLFLAEYMKQRTEIKVQVAAAEKMGTSPSSTESSEDQTNFNIEEVSLEMAKELLEEMADKPLLDAYATEHYGDSSLEWTINDIHAITTTGSKEIILQVCEEAGIDPATATVGDLTVEQISEIDLWTYYHSDHPKN